MPSNFVFANFFETELLDDISAEAGVLHVTPTMAARLPIIGEVMEARLVLWDGINMPEIVGCIDNQQTGYLSVLRAREGTSSRPWPAGTQVICSLTAEIINSALQAYFDITAVLAASFLKLSGGTLTGPLLLAADPLVPLGAVTKQYADAVLGGKLPLVGGTMLGAINMNGNRMLNLPAPVSISEPVRKTELDASVTTQGQVNTDRSGVLTTGGTSAAYTLATASIAGLVDGFQFSARMHVTNAAGATLAKDGGGALPIQAISGIALPEHFLRAGMPYDFVYSGSLNAFLVKGSFISTSRIRPGDVKWSAIEIDHDDCLLCDGRSLLRTDWPSLFANIGTKFGAADGSHFNIPSMNGQTLVGRGNFLAVSHTLSTTNGSTAATVDSNTGLSIGMYVIPGNVSPGTGINDINGVSVTLSSPAIGTGSITTRFSQISDPNVTGALGGTPSRTQNRREVGQHLHTNTVGETPHTHTLNQLLGATVMSTSGGSNAFAAGAFGPISITQGFSLNNASAGVSITNVDSAAPGVMPMLQPSMILNLFIYAY